MLKILLAKTDEDIELAKTLFMCRNLDSRLHSLKGAVLPDNENIIFFSWYPTKSKRQWSQYISVKACSE